MGISLILASLSIFLSNCIRKQISELFPDTHESQMQFRQWYSQIIRNYCTRTFLQSFLLNAKQMLLWEFCPTILRLLAIAVWFMEQRFNCVFIVYLLFPTWIVYLLLTVHFLESTRLPFKCPFSLYYTNIQKNLVTSILWFLPSSIGLLDDNMEVNHKNKTRYTAHIPDMISSFLHVPEPSWIFLPLIISILA